LKNTLTLGADENAEVILAEIGSKNKKVSQTNLFSCEALSSRSLKVSFQLSALSIRIETAAVSAYKFAAHQPM
jgi:hypothetical protein